MADFKDDLDILNYALTLEHLETEMYKQIIASGKLTGDEQGYATQFGAHEAAHVTALTQTIQKLSGTPVAAQAKYNFPAFDTRDNIVKFLVTIEDLGAGAYLAAAPEIKNPDVLTAAVQIHNIEGEHASIWRRQAKMTPVAGAFASPVAKADVLKAAGPILGSGAAAAPAAPAATGTGGATTSTGTGGATTSTGTGGGAVLPQTGAPKQDANNGLAAAVVAGVAAVGVGAALRARSYKRAPKSVN
ncbi:MAG: ferritin-like domain-containing protein [Chloroflexota bacterium]|nr:ferritin-like domain-containing protein [Chloroflexota bacterium]